MTSVEPTPRSHVSPEEDVGRYFSGGKIDDGVLVAGALVVPPDHGNEFSVDRLNFQGMALEEGLTHMRQHATISFRKSGRIVRWNVGALISATLDDRRAIRLQVDEDPLPDNPAHAVLFPVPSTVAEADYLLDLIRPHVLGLYPAIAS